MVIAHYPSDTFAGAVVGIAGARLVRRFSAQRGFCFAIESNGTIHQSPDPRFNASKRLPVGFY